MSWIPKEHKIIYSKSLDALYIDLSNGTNTIVNETGKLLSVGYDKIKDGITYIGNKINETSDNNDNNDNTNNSMNPYYEIDSESSDNIDSNLNDSMYDINHYHYNNPDPSENPDVLIQLSKNDNRIKKIWLLDDGGNRNPVKGKISSHKCVYNIINDWFNYEQKDENWRWYPKVDLYTSYRKATTKLTSMDFVVFRVKNGKYFPFPYHPLY